MKTLVLACLLSAAPAWLAADTFSLDLKGSPAVPLAPGGSQGFSSAYRTSLSPSGVVAWRLGDWSLGVERSDVFFGSQSADGGYIQTQMAVALAEWAWRSDENADDDHLYLQAGVGWSHSLDQAPSGSGAWVSPAAKAGFGYEIPFWGSLSLLAEADVWVLPAQSQSSPPLVIGQGGLGLRLHLL